MNQRTRIQFSFYNFHRTLKAILLRYNVKRLYYTETTMDNIITRIISDITWRTSPLALRILFDTRSNHDMNRRSNRHLINLSSNVTKMHCGVMSHNKKDYYILYTYIINDLNLDVSSLNITYQG